MGPIKLATAAGFAVIYCVWGTTYLAVALALAAIPPFLLMGSRSMLGGGLLLAAAWLRGRPVDAGTWARAGICGVLFFVGCHGTMAYAQQRVPSGLAAVLLATTPFWIALIGALLPGGQRPGWKQLGLLTLGLAGVALVLAGQDKGERSATTSADIALLVGAALSWAVGTVLAKQWSPKDRELAFSGIALLAGGAVLMVMSAWRGELATFDLASMSLTAAGAWIYLTLAGTVLAFAVYTWLLKRVAPALVATYTFVNPLIALLLGWAVLGEAIGVSMAIGALLVIASVGALLLTPQEAPREADHPLRAPSDKTPVGAEGCRPRRADDRSRMPDRGSFRACA
jgi:drug/metabolite transporter (DMT)-like permease